MVGEICSALHFLLIQTTSQKLYGRVQSTWFDGLRCISIHAVRGTRLTEHISCRESLSSGPINNVKCPSTTVANGVGGRTSDLTMDE